MLRWALILAHPIPLQPITPKFKRSLGARLVKRELVCWAVIMLDIPSPAMARPEFLINVLLVFFVFTSLKLKGYGFQDTVLDRIKLKEQL